jgi:hypothetical protein
MSRLSLDNATVVRPEWLGTRRRGNWRASAGGLDGRDPVL